MNFINYNQLFKFDEVFPTAESFETFILDKSDVTPLFDLPTTYARIVNNFKNEGLKHSTFEDVEYELIDIWNENIHKLNSRFTLLSQDYPFLKNVKTTTEISETIDDVRTDDLTRADTESLTDAQLRAVDATDYEKPQFDDLLNSPTGKSVSTDQNDRDLDRSLTSLNTGTSSRDYDRVYSEVVTKQDLTDLEQLELYYRLYDRFSLNDVAKTLQPLFLEVFIIR